jgi:hypothetical protein
MVPAMRRAGYPETFIAGLITAVGAIDVIIPPSIPMIVYGAAAEESVARLYAAGVVPGLMIAAMLAVYVVWRAKRENFGAGEPFQLRVFLHAFAAYSRPPKPPPLRASTPRSSPPSCSGSWGGATLSRPPPRPCCSPARSSSSSPARAYSRGS